MSIEAMKQMANYIDALGGDSTKYRQAIAEAEKQEPVAYMRMPKVGDRVVCIEDEDFGTVQSLTAGGSPDIKFDDGSYGTYLLCEFAELFRYADTHPQPKETQEPDDLRHISDEDFLLDVDEKAWRSLIDNRGGCLCHISPPCGACTDPILEEELNEVGYTYTHLQPKREWVGLMDEEMTRCIVEICNTADGTGDTRDLIRAVEAKLKEKNQ